MKIKEICHDCNYFNLEAKKTYKCYTSSCPAKIRNQREPNKVKAERLRKKIKEHESTLIKLRKELAGV